MRRLSLVLTCCAIPLGAARAQQRSLTLAEALELAQRADPSVVQAEGTARTAGAAVRAAWGEFLPRISSGANYGKSFSALPSRTDPITGQVLGGNVTTGSLGLTASASIDLFTGFRRGANLSLNRANVTDADASLADARAQAALRTTSQFLQVLQSADLVRVRQDAIRRAQDKLAIANAKLATRAATIADSLQAVVDVSRARSQLLQEQQGLIAAQAALARMVGLDGQVSASSDSSLFRLVAVGDTATLMAEAMARSPTVVKASAKVRSARASVGINKAGYWPSLALSGSTSLSGSSTTNYDLLSGRGFSLGLSWNLFDRFARERNLVQAHANLEAAQASEADARRGVSAGLTTQLGALGVAEQRIALATQSLEAARANARVQTERYRLGSISIEQLNQALDALSAAETEAVNARYDYLRAKAQIEAILGRSL
ncbi:MAG TPA: TolC family protein [Gemmatimonadales bacterium]|nr:TolC family protein [Gemmatimonadales bacterium]